VPNVFISHASEDREFVIGELLPLLREHGIHYWFCETSIPAGTEWDPHIVAAIESCDSCLVVLTPEATEKYWVKTEVQLAFRHRKTVVPLLLRTCDAAKCYAPLITIQHIDFRDDRHQARSKLVTTLTAMFPEELRLRSGRVTNDKQVWPPWNSFKSSFGHQSNTKTEKVNDNQAQSTSDKHNPPPDTPDLRKSDAAEEHAEAGQLNDECLEHFASEKVWYVRPPGDREYGPATGETMRKWIAECRVTADSLLWQDGWPDWRKAAEIVPTLRLLTNKRDDPTVNAAETNTPVSIDGFYAKLDLQSRMGSILVPAFRLYRRRWPEIFIGTAVFTILCSVYAYFHLASIYAEIPVGTGALYCAIIVAPILTLFLERMIQDWRWHARVRRHLQESKDLRKALRSQLNESSDAKNED